eukprot:CAMPEP_0185263348 /NCGR_PEP_ID=MMETSP1359-20130426/14274_1 /TAXON_ID=552665 /ORGANISM="Bigelowiella longifila, Strain CCMP242" /LENGTH=100 /DNA_ID=CAMNT_0027850811 /DNA_START=59 /DNA_END=361 /DNA_ORIENTATION=+
MDFDTETIAAIAVTNIATAAFIYLTCSGSSRGRLNNEIQLDSEKVATISSVDEVSKKVKESKVAAYCRCWKSKKFPFCDGAHAKHNKETGDNVGPLVIKN